MKKLSDYAKENKVTYRTAWNRYKKGKIENTIISKTGHILIKEESKYDYSKVAIYCRVSSNENKANLEAQSDRLKNYAIARGYQIVYIIKEVGSGINDKRKKLLK
ncbi:MAG: recombinase family protein, partial [Candidatus Eremiobacterota bacterium]